MKIIVTSIFSVLLFISCKTQQGTLENKSVISDSEINTKMIENGFLPGVIRSSSKENDCDYAIEVITNEENYFLDPINLDENYKKEGTAIWFTFSPLRMANRCEKASPISINEIQKRTP